MSCLTSFRICPTSSAVEDRTTVRVVEEEEEEEAVATAADLVVAGDHMCRLRDVTHFLVTVEAPVSRNLPDIPDRAFLAVEEVVMVAAAEAEAMRRAVWVVIVTDAPTLHRVDVLIAVR